MVVRLDKMAAIETRPSMEEKPIQSPGLPGLHTGEPSDRRGSPVVTPAPLMMNTNRPPSASSNHSSTSTRGAPRATTATSRRGGRVRSRSPPAPISRPTASKTSTKATKKPSNKKDVDPTGRKSPKNPSSAAAAAAAAAKALSNGAGGHSQQGWYNQTADSSKYNYGNNFFGGPQKWPGQDGGVEQQMFGNQHSMQMMHHPQAQRGFSQQGVQGSQAYAYGQLNENMGHSSDPLPIPVQPGAYAAPNQDHAMANQEEHYKEQMGSDPQNEKKRKSKETDARDDDKPTTAKRGAGMTRVIGTPTPIHVPRASDRRTVFRDRPGESGPASAADADENSPQKILLSLRTPTSSFEERDTSAKYKSKSSTKPPMSPLDPPKIKNSQPNLDFFDENPQKSPKSGGNIEMANSFSLFNESFDGIGDSPHYLAGNLETAFQSHSFGAGPVASVDHDAGSSLLPSNMPTPSGGGQYLGPMSSGGMLTFGMSPVNSFGNPAPNGPPRRGGNMMLLGGPDGAAASPTQVLGMYPSYSGGFPSSQVPSRSRSGPMGDEHMRSLSTGGSFGGSALQPVYTKSFDQPQQVHYSGGASVLQPVLPPLPSGPLAFYDFLCKNKGAFANCSFLLPKLKAALLESPPPSRKKGKSKSDSHYDRTSHDTVIAMRRVTSAICAFGGSISADNATMNATKQASSKNSQSIFREKDGAASSDHATVTPSSSTGSPPGTRFQSPARKKYDQMLPTRYYENENRLSWEFEESPPVEISSGTTKKRRYKRVDIDTDEFGNRRETSSPMSQFDGEGEEVEDGLSSADSTPTGRTKEKKMKYRCKLCGKPKQNHVCMFQKSLARSIGAMVYPAVNAFTAHEPGLVAPALSDMNNFVEGIPSSTESSPARTPKRKLGSTPTTTPKGRKKLANVTVTPENKTASLETPEEATSMDIALPTPQRQKRKSKGKKSDTPSPEDTGSEQVIVNEPTHVMSRKRPLMHLASGSEDQMSLNQASDLLFVNAIELKPEQFRVVSHSKKDQCPDAYKYPPLPLPYAQRKRLSDNLFALSKEVPQLTDECAVVLREAREKDMWDLAVAELMTQVVIVIHCRDGDTRFEGLRQYLLTLAISC